MQKESLFIIDQGQQISSEKQSPEQFLLGGKKKEQEVILSDSEDEDESEQEEENSQQNSEENNSIKKIAEELVDDQSDKNVKVQYGDKNTSIDTKIVFKDGKMRRVTKKLTTQKLSLIKNINETEEISVQQLPETKEQKTGNKLLQKNKKIEKEHVLSDENDSEEEQDSQENSDSENDNISPKISDQNLSKQIQESREQVLPEKQEITVKIESKNSQQSQVKRENLDQEQKSSSYQQSQKFQFNYNDSDDESNQDSDEDEEESQQNKKLKTNRQSKRIPRQNEYQVETEGEELEDTESEEESQEVMIATTNKLKYKKNVQNNNNSMVFEEEEEDSDQQSMLSEESHVEEFENLKQNYNKNQSLLKTYDYPQQSKVGYYCSVGTCCFVFCMSSILWIILLRNLIIKNQHIRQIVYDIPTLGTYHELYTDFFNQYDNNRDKLFETQEILKLKNNPDFKLLQDNVSSFVTSQDQLNNDLYESKVLLASLQDKKDKNQQRRKLSKSSHKKHLNNDQKIDFIIKKLEDSQENLINMEKRLKQINEINQNNFGSVYDQAIENLTKLYEDSFNLVDLYGRFYVMTNRIWVTTKNIYNLFDKRVQQIDEEMKKEHFKVYQSLGENIHLPELNYKIVDLIPKVEAINLIIEEPSLVQCKLEYEVDNSDLSLIDNTFDLYIVLDGQINQEVQNKNSFHLKVNSKNDADTFQNFFELNEGNHQINIFGKVYKENLKFKYIDLKCLVFLEYPDIEEYSKVD